MKKLKKIPRGENGQPLREFSSKKHRYYWLDIDSDGFAFNRLNWFNKLSVAAGYNCSFEQWAKNINEAISLCNQIGLDHNKVGELIHHLYNIRAGLMQSAEHNNDWGLYLCTLMFCREGDDPAQWSFDIADGYLADLGQEYDAMDFLSYGLGSINGFRTEYLKLARGLKDMASQKDRNRK